jgi:hypothetical protein
MKPSRAAAVLIIALLAAIALGLVVILQLGTSSHPAHRAASRHLGSQRASGAVDDLTLARRLGQEMGGAHPDDISTVNTTRHRALEVLFPGEDVGGPGVQQASRVHVVEMHGSFVDEQAHPPAENGRSGRSQLPHGKWLTVVLDPSSNQVLDLLLGSRRPRLQPLGLVTHIATGP